MLYIDNLNLIVTALIMSVAAAIPALLPRLPLPGVVLEILLGALVGPQVLALVHPGPILSFLANFGLCLLLLMAGFEMDPVMLRGRPSRLALEGWGVTCIVSLGAALLLQAVGLATAWPFTGLVLTTTSIGILLPILRDSGLLARPYGPLVLSSGAIGEAGPVIGLSLLLAGSHALLQAVAMLGFGLATVVVLVLATRIRGGYLETIVARTIVSSGQLPMRLAICVLILFAALSAMLHIEIVLGAFVAGLVVRAGLSHHHAEAFSARLDGIGSALLVPIFFVASGARLDIAGLLSSPVAIAMVPLYAFLMLAHRPPRPGAAFGHPAFPGRRHHRNSGAESSDARQPGRGPRFRRHSDRDPVSDPGAAVAAARRDHGRPGGEGRLDHGWPWRRMAV